MVKRETFSIPSGLRLSPGAGGIDVEFDGDIVLQGNPHPKLGRVRSTSGDVFVQVEVDVGVLAAPQGTVNVAGTVRAGRIEARTITIQGAATVDEIEATGMVELRGNITANLIRGESVMAEGPTLDARVVAGRRSVRVSRGRIQSDILIAPSVLLDPSATGKIKVVESQTDLGAHSVRGCLRLSDLEDMGGSAASFLAERGLEPLAASPEPAAEPPAPPPPAPPAPPPTVPNPGAAARWQPTPDAPTTPFARPTAPAAAAPPKAPVEAPEPSDPIQAEISQILGKILACYPSGDLPPAIVDLRDWVNRRDYGAVRDGITSAWNQLLKFHQKQGMRIQPQVTTNFNQLNSLVRKL